MRNEELMEFLCGIFDVSIPQGIVNPNSTTARKRKQKEHLQIETKRKIVPIFPRELRKKERWWGSYKNIINERKLLTSKENQAQKRDMLTWNPATLWVSKWTVPNFIMMHAYWQCNALFGVCVHICEGSCKSHWEEIGLIRVCCWFIFVVL